MSGLDSSSSKSTPAPWRASYSAAKLASLRPVPPGVSKHKDVRYLDIREDLLDEAQFVDWVKQASQLPGERL